MRSAGGVARWLRGLCGPLAVLVVATPAAAVDLWRDGDRSLELSGSVRQIVQYSHGTGSDEFLNEIENSLPSLDCVRSQRFHTCPAFEVVDEKELIQSLTRLRLRFDLHWGRLSGVVAYDHELLGGTIDTLGSEIGSDLEERTFMRAEDNIVTDEQFRWRHRLYRAFLRWEGKHLEATVGRLRVPWGVARLWNPIDRFNAIPPLAIEADQSTGVDAIDLRWRFNGFDSIQAVYTPGANTREAKYAARLQGVVRDFDVGLVAGVFDRAVTVGGDLAGNLGGAAFGMEVVWTDPHRDVWPVGRPSPRRLKDYWQVVGFVDYSFDVGSGLYVLLEHLYNGNALGFGRGKAGPLLGFFASTNDAPAGLPSSLGPFVTTADTAIFGGSRVVTFSEQITGFQMSYDLATSLRGSFLTLYDWEGTSAAFYPSLQFTGWNSLDITFGAQLFVGEGRSQYGDKKPLVFLIAEWFF